MSLMDAAPEAREESTRPSAWDTRLFVLRGEDRESLREQALALANDLGESETPLGELAHALARELPANGLTLAVIAASLPDLRAKLVRAGERLAKPDCRHIRDSAGVYFADQPLFRTGSLAVLFPGEGAQYSGMLADLCAAFPEVEETFAWSDRLAQEHGKAEESLRQLLHLPADASLEERAAAEARLRTLGPSIFSVLLADLALYRVLTRLELPVSAVAGHSAGELAALTAAGAMPDIGPKLLEVVELMQRQEEENNGPEVTLLAIGAGKALVEQIAETAAGGSVAIAMDNCPHQCIAVGPTPDLSRVESALLSQGVVCERLPFRRPYHTAMFEPWMEPYRQLFAPVAFVAPSTSVFSCTTAQPFPPDGDAIRDLAVNQWVSPVEFTRTIEAMYASGVRLFVEAGPRGNLSAFTEDILRGKPFAAIPSNVPRRSGPTQINHLVGQLLVHEVPLNLECLFQEWEYEANSGPQASARETLADGFDEVAAASDLSPRTAALNGYLDVMERFLDVQREVMAAFLTGQSRRETPLEALDLEAFRDLAEDLVPPQGEPPFALMESIVHLEPGVSIAVQRTLDEREDLYADHHTLAGRGVSRVNPGQNGLPVLPMTFSVEGMSEAATLLAPGKVVTAVKNLRLFRWIPFDPTPTTLEIRAEVAGVNEDTGVVEVRANVRDLGNSFLKDGASKVAAEATLLLADEYPASPEPMPFALTDERPCQSTVEDLRRNMFHGPLFQMLQHLGRIGDEGIEGLVEVQPRDGWFRSNPNPRLVLDPVLLDASMHILGAWHLEQPDWTGRILLPFEITTLEFFSPPPAVGSQLLTRGHNEQESARHFRHSMEVFNPDGTHWYRMLGAGYWRFYLPFGHVNFFGPKDEYYLCRHWPEASPAGQSRPPRRCYYLDPPVDLKQPVLRAAGARVTMTPRELQEFMGWSGSDAELNDWFFGRLVAKDAARAAWNERYGVAIFPADIEAEFVNGRYLCRHREDNRTEPLPPACVAIAGSRVAAFSAYADQLGVALIKVEKGENVNAVRARAACQSVANALGIAANELSASPSERDGSEYIVSASGRKVLAQTAVERDYVAATTLAEEAAS
jgi:malonyl CoA-acyl carrier protein transacylase